MPEAGGAVGEPPRPASNAAAVLEAAGPWLVALLVAAVLFMALLAALQQHQVRQLREARLAISLQEIRDRLEADLALGFELEGSSTAQGLLEDALQRDGSLLAAEVFDAAGLSLFNTDRGSIGERVPESWLEATRQLVPGSAMQERLVPWSTEGVEPALGLPVRGPFGQVVGHVSLVPSPQPLPRRVGQLAVAGACVVVLGLLGWLAAARAVRARARTDDGRALHQAAARLAAAQQRVDEALARLVESESRAA